MSCGSSALPCQTATRAPPCPSQRSPCGPSPRRSPTSAPQRSAKAPPGPGAEGLTTFEGQVLVKAGKVIALLRSPGRTPPLLRPRPPSAMTVSSSGCFGEGASSFLDLRSGRSSRRPRSRSSTIAVDRAFGIIDSGPGQCPGGPRPPTRRCRPRFAPAARAPLRLELLADSAPPDHQPRHRLPGWTRVAFLSAPLTCLPDRSARPTAPAAPPPRTAAPRPGCRSASRSGLSAILYPHEGDTMAID